MKRLCRPFALLAGLLLAAAGMAQDYPARPVRIVVAFAPGGIADVAARLLAQQLSEALRQPFTVENRPGAGGIIGIDSVAKAAPDGYTLLMASNGEFTMGPHLYSKLPYRPMEDFIPISILSETPSTIFANAESPITSFAQLIAAAKARPGEIAYSSPGNGSTSHITAEWLFGEAGIKLLHVAYKGGAPAAAAVASGEVPVGMNAVSSMQPFVRAGKVRVLAVTSPKRLDFAPDWPTVAESGIPGFVSTVWSVLFAPAGVPRPIIDRLGAEVVRAARAPEVRQRLAGIGSEALGTTPEDTLARLKQDYARFAVVIPRARIRID
jgi:tripartite-type tricarboxylate transporter receptor subunit TctC